MIYLSSRVIENLLKESSTQVQEGNFKLLDVLHHLSAGFKSISTDMMYKGLDEMRSSCGGAGYHVASGMVSIFVDQAPFSTFEGVNTLMT